MAKKTVTKYELPLTDTERKEIVEILKPAYIQNEKVKVARSLQKSLLNELVAHLSSIGPNYHLNEIGKPFSHQHLNKKLREIVGDWYNEYVARLGADILPEDISVTVSQDGLFVLTYSDTVKKIIVDYDYNLEPVGVDLPHEDSELAREVNEYLEQQPQEE